MASSHAEPLPRRRTVPGAELLALWQTAGGRALVLLSAAVLALTCVGLVLLWPDGEHDRPAAASAPTVAATVVAQRTVDCPGTSQPCRQVVVEVDGARTPITLGPLGATADLDAGTDVRVARVPIPEGAPAGIEPWSFVDVDRRGGLGWLAAALVLVAVLTLRLRGALAALGVVASVALVVWFLIPALLEGTSPLLVAITAAMAVTWITVVLTHGLTAPTLAAAVGVAVTVVAAAGLGEIAVRLVQLDGTSSELSSVLAQQPGSIDLRGVVLAGMLIGALGVLADTAVTQSSAVMALRRARPDLSARELHRRAIAVGRDHLAATIHTLVLAYAGTALPLLLVLHSVDASAADALNAQDVAEPVAAAIVGCLTLIAAVPLTTALASFLAVRTPAAALPDGHGHGHGHAH